MARSQERQRKQDDDYEHETSKRNTGVEATMPAPEDMGAAIAERAYALHLERGATHGHDLDDWLEAEREVHQRAR